VLKWSVEDQQFRSNSSTPDPFVDSVAAILPIRRRFRCVEYGILPEQEAEQLYKKILKRKGKGPGAAVSSPTPVKKKKKPVKVIGDEGVDPDMQLSSGEGIGRAVL
jgi:hypothetical protein